jgi:hypothetical protein
LLFWRFKFEFEDPKYCAFLTIFASLGDKPILANRRAEVIDWLGGLLPEFDLPLDSSDEELREYLIDGTALCYIAEKLMPGIQEVTSLSSGRLN